MSVYQLAPKLLLYIYIYSKHLNFVCGVQATYIYMYVTSKYMYQ